MRMMEQILDRQNLQRAWQKVMANAGAPGVDGMIVKDFPAFARAHWERIRSALREGSYCPAPVRRVWIPKPDGSQRPLGVPTVLDRVIQQALAQVLGPLFESGFSESSYGFREGRARPYPRHRRAHPVWRGVVQRLPVGVGISDGHKSGEFSEPLRWGILMA